MVTNDYIKIKSKSQRESDIQKQILDALNKMPRTFAFRTSNNAIYDMKRKIFRRKPKRDLGMADIIVCKGDKFMALEVKTGNKKAEPHQYEWLKKVANVGGHASVVHSVDEAMESWLEA